MSAEHYEVCNMIWDEEFSACPMAPSRKPMSSSDTCSDDDFSLTEDSSVDFEESLEDKGSNSKQKNSILTFLRERGVRKPSI